MVRHYYAYKVRFLADLCHKNRSICHLLIWVFIAPSGERRHEDLNPNWV